LRSLESHQLLTMEEAATALEHGKKVRAAYQLPGT
jgi:hypothetical protein